MPLADRSGSNKLQQVELFLGRFAGFSHGKRSERGCHVPIGNLANKAIGGAEELRVIYFPTNWGAKEPQNLPNHRVAKDDGTWICVISWMNILKG